MSRLRVNVSIVFVMLLLIAGIAGAGESKDEKNLDREVKRLNDTVAKPDGEKAVVKRLMEELTATEPQIMALRDRKLDYGEITVILSFARTMPGGVTDANVQKVLDMRQGPPAVGWSDVAVKLGTKLGKNVSQVRKIANNANREIKHDHARGDKAQTTAQPEQQEHQESRKPDPYAGEGRSLPQGENAQ